MGASQPSIPKAPSPAKTYEAGIRTYLKYEPQLLAGEQAARGQYDPQRIQSQLNLQGAYGPTQYAQQLQALQQLDPTGQALRTQLGGQISADLARGTQLDPKMAQQLQQEIRGAQTARGNIIGNAPASAEALYQGERGQALYQQRLANAGTFLSSPTPEQQLLAVSPVAADRSSQYVNPGAGYLGQQFALSNYQNLLAQTAASGGQQNPWMGALGGAASGALAGAQLGSVYPGLGTAAGAIGGGVIGGVAGGFGYSDARLKTDIEDTGLEKAGVPLKTFSFKSDPAHKRYAGVIAQDLKKKVPEAVGKAGKYLTVAKEFRAVPLPA